MLAMRLAKTDRSAALAKDVVINSLGYWTDSVSLSWSFRNRKHGDTLNKQGYSANVSRV